MTGVRHQPWADVCARRLDRHGLSRPSEDDPAQVVAAISGAHAQVMSAAELSVGLRLRNATRTTVREALWTERSLVKTFGPRGTVHLLPTRDLPLWTAALSAVPSTASPMPKGAEMTPQQTDDVIAAIADALLDAELTVDELTEAIVARAGAWAGDPVMPAFQGMWPRWRKAMATAANRGALVFGPGRGRRVTYTSPQRWLPGFSPADGEGAVRELARRYLHAYGPATARQFARWLNAPRGWATALFDSMAGELERVDIGGPDEAWLLADDADARPAEPGGLRLLPHFDAYTVGCHPRELLFPGPAADRALSRGQAGNFPVLVIDGTVAGVWQLRRSGQRLDITVEPLHPLTATQRGELDEQVERIGQIAEGRPALTVGTVTVGPHA